MEQNIAAGGTDSHDQASNIYNKVKATFNKTQLKLSNIELRGQNKEKEFFILATFSSIAEAKTFEH